MRSSDYTSCLVPDCGVFGGAQVKARRAALERILARIQGQYQSLLDPLAGTGADARLLSADKTQTYVNDIDPKCRELLKANFNCIGSSDFFTKEGRRQLEVHPDLVFLDFNNWTQHKFKGRYGDCTRWAFGQAKKFVILNDSTFFYLRQYGRLARAKVGHLLGTQLSSLDDYVVFLRDLGLPTISGWHATAVEQFYVASPKGNGGAAYVLFENRPVTRITHQTPGRYCQLMDIPEISELRKGFDFRKPEYRREVFLRFYEWSLKTRSFPGCVYFVMPHLYKTLKWDRESRLWFAFLNGNTQNPVTSWIIFKRFPNLAKLQIAALENWFNKEFKRLAFDTDRRHQKSDFMDSVKCYLKITQGKQEEFFSSFINSEDQHENFREAWDVVRNQFYSFGRLASFSYLEYLRIMRVNLDCDQLFLEDMKGSQSHRNGLAKVLGRDDLDWHDSNPTDFDGKYTPEMLAWLNQEAALLLNEAKNRVAGQPYANDVSYFTLESTFCTYKSWHRPNRRYPGVYVDMLYDRIKKAEAAWPEEDFSIFWDARKTYLPEYIRLEDNPDDIGVKPEKQNHYRLTGEVIMLDHDWPCFANSYRKSSKAASAR